MRVFLIIAALVALTWAGVSQIPLGFALRQLPLNAMGVNWTQSEGTIWNGRIMGVYLNGQPVGDIDVALQPASLITLQPKVDFQWGGAGGRGAGTVGMNGDRISASNLRIEQRISAMESLSPEVRAVGGVFRLSQGALRIEGNQCTSATGRLSSDTLSIAAEQFGREFSDLSGTLDCVDGAFSIDMNGSGPTGDTVAVAAEATLYGRSEIKIVANTNDDEIESLLASAGFNRRDGVWTFIREMGASGQGTQ